MLGRLELLAHQIDVALRISGISWNVMLFLSMCDCAQGDGWLKSVNFQRPSTVGYRVIVFKIYVVGNQKTENEIRKRREQLRAAKRETRLKLEVSTNTNSPALRSRGSLQTEESEQEKNLAEERQRIAEIERKERK